MRVGGQTLARVATLVNSHPRLTGPLLLVISFIGINPLYNTLSFHFSVFDITISAQLFALISQIHENKHVL